VQFDIISAFSGNLDSLNAKFKNMQNKDIFSVGPEQSPLEPTLPFYVFFNQMTSISIYI
jgi:hypothetical protein